jgi:hypothetical protein
MLFAGSGARRSWRSEFWHRSRSVCGWQKSHTETGIGPDWSFQQCRRANRRLVDDHDLPLFGEAHGAAWGWSRPREVLLWSWARLRLDWWECQVKQGLRPFKSLLIDLSGDGACDRNGNENKTVNPHSRSILQRNCRGSPDFELPRALPTGAPYVLLG